MIYHTEALRINIILKIIIFRYYSLLLKFEYTFEFKIKSISIERLIISSIHISYLFSNLKRKKIHIFIFSMKLIIIS